MTSIRAFLSDLVDVGKRGVKKHKKGILYLGITLFLVISVLSAIMFKVSETPWFCGVCHNMKPYIDSWKVSSHKDVSCIECHYEPGFINHVKGKMTDGQVSLVYFLTGKTPGKYHAEISDASCLQCHQKESLSTDKQFKGVSFSHSNHLGSLRRGKKLRCTTCHGQIVQGEHIAVDTKDCFICHFKPEENGRRHPVLADCRTCHKEIPLEIEIQGRIFHHQRYVDDGIDCRQCHIDIIKGDGSMIENKCVECHNEPTFITDNFSAEALHLNHVTDHKVECWHCHRDIKHEVVRNPTAINFSENCTTCHQNNEHLGPRQMYMGTGGIGVEDSPAVMYKANVDCASCHQKSAADEKALHSVNFQALALGEACNRCHGEGYDTMLQRWKEVLTEETNDTNLRIFKAQNLLFQNKSKAESPEFRQAQQLISEARHNFNFVIMGSGQHNVEYAIKLLNVARAKTQRAMGILDPDHKPEPIKTVEYSCSNLCHTEMESRTVKLGNANYPHKTHIVDLGLSCTDCHSGREQHGRTNLELCKDCHHGPGKGAVTCNDCHQEVSNLYAGTGAFGVKGKPSFKFGQVECADCHSKIKESAESPHGAAESSCKDCHEKDYQDVLAGWRDRVAKAIDGQQKRIKAVEDIVQKQDRYGSNTVKARNFLVRIRENEKMITGDRGLHNPEFAEAIAKANELMLKKAEEILLLEASLNGNGHSETAE